MTNTLAAITGTLLSVVVTNWATVGTMQLTQEPRTFQVQQGKLQTNIFAVLNLSGSNAWLLLRVFPGEPLKGHRLVERVTAGPLHEPPLPIAPMPQTITTNVGTVLLEK